MLAVPDDKTTSGLRDRAMLEVLYCTGIRRAELAHLNVRDIDTQRFTLMIRQGKGRKDRLVPIHNRCLTWDHRLPDRGATGTGRQTPTTAPCSSPSTAHPSPSTG